MIFIIGSTIRMTCSPTDPETGAALGQPQGYSAEIDFWAPGLDRTEDAPSVADQAMTWDAVNSYFEKEISTSTAVWDDPGVWSFEVTTTGASRTKVDAGVFQMRS